MPRLLRVDSLWLREGLLMIDYSNPTTWTLKQTLHNLKFKNISEAELNRAYYDQINKHNSELNAFLEVTNSKTGIPVAVKDVISTKGIKTTAGSRILKDYIPVYDATVIERLLFQKCSIIGKTNCDEFAMGSSGENSAYGPTKNPWDLTRVPGGSSSGSAVAVAADMSVFSIGTDTGGSIRQPASFCGVVGLKPAYGDVSRYGFIAMASSLDCPGIFSKTVEDAKLILEWISGGDWFDSHASGSYTQTLALSSLKGLKVGLPKEYFAQGLDSKVKEVVEKAIQNLEKLGAQIVEVTLPHTEYAVATYYLIMASEVSSNLARFDGIRFGGPRSDFGAEAKRRIMLGTYTLSAGYFDDYFMKAAKMRTLIAQDFEQAFQKCDLIAGPVSPTVAWKIGEKVADPLAMYLQDVYTVPASLAGIAGISVPCGFAYDLPVGLQMLGSTKQILDVADIYQRNNSLREIKPKL